ncbi:transposase [Streptomyces sp. NPDC054771]
MRVRDRLDGLWCDKDFVDWYPRDGRPGLSPVQLATVCVLQFLLDLSDRQAAEAVRCRIGFKYALAMELDDPGFHHSVLADFRERLAQDDRADRLLDLELACPKEAGLVRERTTQRTDSTHVLAAVRDLTRLEMVTEAVRAVHVAGSPGLQVLRSLRPARRPSAGDGPALDRTGGPALGRPQAVPTFITDSIDGWGAQLYPGSIATPAPQAFGVASPPIRGIGFGADHRPAMVVHCVRLISARFKPVS